MDAEMELKPCPFCGSDAAHVFPPTCDRRTPYEPGDRAFPEVRCPGCYAAVSGENWDQEGTTAVAAWNTRATQGEGEGSSARELAQTVSGAMDEVRHADALYALVNAARRHMATHPVYRSKPVGMEGSHARLAQDDRIATEDALRAAVQDALTQPEALTLPEAGKEGGSSGGNALASPDGLTDALHSAGELRHYAERDFSGAMHIIDRKFNFVRCVLPYDYAYTSNSQSRREAELICRALEGPMEAQGIWIVAPPAESSAGDGSEAVHDRSASTEHPSPNPPVKVEKSWCEMCGGAGRLYSLDRMASADCEWCPTDVSSGKGS